MVEWHTLSAPSSVNYLNIINCKEQDELYFSTHQHETKEIRLQAARQNWLDFGIGRRLRSESLCKKNNQL